eukprot:jgi/Ulvmu1/2732/UM014_0189.1
MESAATSWRSAYSVKWLPRSAVSVIQNASCDYNKSAPSPLVKDFFSHFDPKYDVPRPSHTESWLTMKRLAFFLGRRVLVDGYISFCFSFNEFVSDLENEPDKEHDFDVVENFQDAFVHPFKSYMKAATLEWVAEGIRIAYGKVVHDSWNRRTAWKFLKGSMQSSLRKLARGGVMNVPLVFKAEARGQILPASAHTTLRLILHPWDCREYYFWSSDPTPAKLTYLAKYTTVELACLLARIVGSGIGGLMGISVGYHMYRLIGGESGTSRWEQMEGGRDRPVPAAIFMPWALSCTVSDAVISMVLRPVLEQALDMVPIDADNN